MTAVPSLRDSSFLRTCPGGGYSKCFFIPRLWSGPGVGQLNEPGAKAEPFSSRPRRPTTSDGRQPELPIKSTESSPAQRRPGRSCRQ
jgi:hypothetical protein